MFSPREVAGRRDDADVADEIDGDVGACLRVERLRADELAPLRRGRALLRGGEGLAGRGLVADDDDGDPATLRILVFCTMCLEPRADLGLGDVGGRGRVLARLGEHRVAEDRAHLLLRDRVLVVALRRGLLREELHGDHLVEQLLAALDRLVPEPIELIHVLERRGVVAERDRVVPDLRERLLGLLGRERGRLSVPRVDRVRGPAALAGLAAARRRARQASRAPRLRQQRAGNGRTTGLHGRETYHRMRSLARLPPRD